MSESAGARLFLILRSLLVHLTVWVATVIFGTLAMIVTLIERKRLPTDCAAMWGWIICKVAGVRIEVEGLENLAKDRCQVIAGNHASNFDIYVVAQILRPYYYRFVAKKELQYIPIFGWALWMSGTPFVDRSNSPKAQATMRRLFARMRGSHMTAIMFPEGTRNREKGLMRFKKGAFVLALDLEAPIVPMVIHGARRTQARHSFLVRPETIRVEFLEPIPTAGLSYHDRDGLIQQTRNLIHDRLGPEER